MTLDNVDCLGGVLGIAVGVVDLDRLDGIDYYVAEELHFCSYDFGGHAGHGTVDECFCA